MVGSPRVKGGGCLTTVSGTRLYISIGLGQPGVTSVGVVARGRTTTFVVYSRIVTRFLRTLFLPPPSRSVLVFSSLFVPFFFFCFPLFAPLVVARLNTAGTRASFAEDVDRETQVVKRDIYIYMYTCSEEENHPNRRETRSMIRRVVFLHV